MFRTMVLSGVTALGLVFASANTNSADAADVRFELRGGNIGIGIGIGGGYDRGRYDDHCEHYTVLYREGCHSRWQVYGTYHNHRRAHEIARSLEYRGYDAQVRHSR